METLRSYSLLSTLKVIRPSWGSRLSETSRSEMILIREIMALRRSSGGGGYSLSTPSILYLRYALSANASRWTSLAPRRIAEEIM